VLVLIEFFTWWFGRGYGELIYYCLSLIKKVQRSFSIPILLSTLFSPWRQIVTLPGRSFDEKMRAVLDNLVSRTVGFCVRIISLVTALILMILAVALGVIMAVSWPLIPALVVYCLVRGILG
jgi:hypothetical protein